MAWSPPVDLSLLLLVFTLLGAESRDVLPQKENYLPSYDVYHNVSSLSNTITRLLQQNPKLFSLYRTFESRQKLSIPVIRAAPRPSDSERPLRVLIIAGEHAREFFPVESALHLLRQLAREPPTPLGALMRARIDLYLVPLLNPDGRRLLERQANFCWRGTSTGVDLSRNFPWEFGLGKGSSSKPSDEEFRGKNALSEPESRIVQLLGESIQFDGFLSLHSGIRHIYIPFSDSKSRVTQRKPPHWKVLETISEKMAAAMGKEPGHAFRSGPAWKLNDYSADGTVFDFMAGVRHVPVSLAVELWGEGDRPGIACFDLFNPHSKNLQTELNRLLPLYQSFFSALWSSRRNFTRHAPMQTSPASDLPYPLLALLACVVAILGALCKRRLCTTTNTQWRLLAPGRKRIISLRQFGQRFSFSSLKSV